MRNFEDKEENKEKIIGGILGSFAILAAIISTILGEVNGSTIWNCIKDIAGTLTTVILFLAVLNKNKVKKSKNFKEEFDKLVDEVLSTYQPYVVRKEGKDEEFQITPNLKCLFGSESRTYNDFFSFDLKSKFDFSVRKGLFFTRGEATDDIVEGIARSISDKLGKEYSEYIEQPVLKKDGTGFTVTFKRDLCTLEDAKLAAQFINSAIMCYIAYNHTL